MNVVWWTVLLVVGTCESARILIFQPATAKSHSLVTQPLFEELAARGHYLTVITSFPHKPPLPNLEEVDVSTILPSSISNFSFEMIRETMGNPFRTPVFMTEIELLMCEILYKEDEIKSLLNSDEKFDLVIAETFSADCFASFAHKFNAPLVAIVTSISLPWVTDRMGLPDNPSYIPNYLVDFPTEMTFFQRIYNTVTLGYAKLVFNYYTIPQSEAIITKNFGDSCPPLGQILRNTSLLLVNSHFALSTSRPFPPNVVEIGGIHLRKSSNALPKDLQDILDRSTQGAIMVCFGSLVRMSTLPPNIIHMFISVFSRMPQTVIFKYEEDLLGLPPNVVIRKWLPQREITEHKNIRALLVHGGLASTIETVQFGKPIVGIPFFADQYNNLQAVAWRGAGIVLSLDSLSEQTLETALNQVLTNPKYAENMRRLSLQFRDRPMTALDTAVYWTEYVIRHQGAPHLRPASVNLPLHQYLLLDVIAVLLLPLILLLYVVYFLFFSAVEVSPNDYRNYKLNKDD